MTFMIITLGQAAWDDKKLKGKQARDDIEAMELQCLLIA